ncbi:MAG: hypothetical protein ACI85O_001513 [Saprospiraceae bacterium]|jgi:hypothetical protein
MKIFIFIGVAISLTLFSCRKIDESLPYNPYVDEEIINLVEVTSIEYTNPEPYGIVHYKVNLDALLPEQRERITGLYYRRVGSVLFRKFSLDETSFGYPIVGNSYVRFGGIVLLDDGTEIETTMGSEILLQL